MKRKIGFGFLKNWSKNLKKKSIPLKNSYFKWAASLAILTLGGYGISQSNSLIDLKNQLKQQIQLIGQQNDRYKKLESEYREVIQKNDSLTNANSSLISKIEQLEGRQMAESKPGIKKIKNKGKRKIKIAKKEQADSTKTTKKGFFKRIADGVKGLFGKKNKKGKDSTEATITIDSVAVEE